MTADMDSTTRKLFNPRHPIDPDQVYSVDIFCRNWTKVVDVYTQFEEGGVRFVANGRSLKYMMNKCPTFDEDEEIAKKKYKKRVACFKVIKRRNDVVDKYRSLFYSKSTEAKTYDDFQALIIRPRNKRFVNRLRFTFLVVKSLKCDECENNKCVYNALKLFYNHDKKCIDEVDRLVAKE